MLMADLLPTSDVSTAQLYPGDRIVLYTDGLTEARDRTGKLICSEEDLAERAGDRSRDVSTLCEDIFQDVLSKTGGMDFLEDDITFLIAEYTGS